MLHTSVNSFLFDLQFIRNAEQQRLQIQPLPVRCIKNIQLKNFTVPVICKEVRQLIILLVSNHPKQNPLPFCNKLKGVQYSSEMHANTPVETLGKARAIHR